MLEDAVVELLPPPTTALPDAANGHNNGHPVDGLRGQPKEILEEEEVRVRGGFWEPYSDALRDKTGYEGVYSVRTDTPAPDGKGGVRTMQAFFVIDDDYLSGVNIREETVPYDEDGDDGTAEQRIFQDFVISQGKGSRKRAEVKVNSERCTRDGQPLSRDARIEHVPDPKTGTDKPELVFTRITKV